MKNDSWAPTLNAVLAAAGLVAPPAPHAAALDVPIAMFLSEAQRFVQEVRASGVHRYLEWGTGGSTMLLAWLMVSQQLDPRFTATAIESSVGWLAHIRNASKFVGEAEATGKLRLVHADIGPTEFLGRPVNWMATIRAGNATRAMSYVSPDSLMNDDRHHRPFDLVLDDGRWRVACALQVLRGHCHSRTRVLLHDWGDQVQVHRNSTYSYLLKYYSLVQRDMSLNLLSPKQCFRGGSEEARDLGEQIKSMHLHSYLRRA